MTTTFKYQAKDSSGKTVSGTMQAGSQSEVVADLRRRRLTPIDIKKTGGGHKMFARTGQKRVAKNAAVKKGELEGFTRQLSTMTSARTPMIEGLENLADWTAIQGFKDVPYQERQGM